jgi:glycosyltransferase involved in cell wall biosynthesis
MVVVEAMARMKRVIATKCGGPEEIITDGVDGFLVDKENPEAMANKLEKLIQNHEESLDAPNQAYATAIDKYSIEKVAHNLSAILNKISEK